jgi:hypothetical protein
MNSMEAVGGAIYTEAPELLRGRSYAQFFQYYFGIDLVHKRDMGLDSLLPVFFPGLHKLHSVAPVLLDDPNYICILGIASDSF